jgi:pyruvate/2-oxoglutarate dehydrogenase complex dihydrolipoamide dehydrogenase (E3) component
MDFRPLEEHDQRLARNSYPADWLNPTPPGRYNLVVVGGSAAGIVAALATADLQGRVALIERHRLADDSLNTGCVPSKTLLRVARAACQASRSDAFGKEPASNTPHNGFALATEQLRRLQTEISRRDSAWRLTGCGVDVYLGAPRFVGPNQLDVDGTALEFDRAIIATGSRPATSNSPGLEEVGYHTSNSIFSLATLPRSLVVIGGGPVACELGQAFRRFGSEVHLITDEDGILPAEDRQAAAIVLAQFEREGIRIHTGAVVVAARKTGRSKSVVVEQQGRKLELIADEILVALGREPNVGELGIEAAGVRFSATGIEVDDRLQTSNRSIFAAGDVCAAYPLIHDSEAMARVSVHNALFFGRRRLSRLAIPRCTYTDPELAHVGLTPREADSQGLELDSFRVDLRGGDRLNIDGDPPGFVVLHTRRGRSRVVGATIVAAQAGEMIGQISLLMSRRLPISALSDMTHCRPTESEAFGRAADQYQRRRLTPRVKRVLDRWFTWRRQPRPQVPIAKP